MIYIPRLCLDGAGGVIVTWFANIFNEATGVDTYAQAFVQRYNNIGAP